MFIKTHSVWLLDLNSDVTNQCYVHIIKYRCFEEYTNLQNNPLICSDKCSVFIIKRSLKIKGDLTFVKLCFGGFCVSDLLN